MLAKTERLTKKQFDQFFASGRRFHFSEVTVVYTPYDTFHGAVVVGKKVAKRAVTRNTLRRRVYGLLYRQVKQANQTGVYIVLVKPVAATLPRRELQQRITTHIATVLKKT